MVFIFPHDSPVATSCLGCDIQCGEHDCERGAEDPRGCIGKVDDDCNAIGAGRQRSDKPANSAALR